MSVPEGLLAMFRKRIEYPIHHCPPMITHFTQKYTFLQGAYFGCRGNVLYSAIETKRRVELSQVLKNNKRQ